MSRTTIAMSAAIAIVTGLVVFLWMTRSTPDVELPEAAPAADGYILQTMPVVAGTSSEGYVKVTPALVLTEGTSSAILGNNITMVEAATFEVLSDFPIETLETPAGLDALRSELTDAFGEVLGDENVSRVVLNDLVMQPPSG